MTTVIDLVRFVFTSSAYSIQLDTAGQEEYATMRDTYIRTGEGFLVAYAMTSRTSFDDAKQHYNQILRVKDSDKFPMVLVANKADLEDQREIPEVEGRSLATQWGVPFFETSAFNRQNVDECFFEAVREVRRADQAAMAASNKPQKKMNKKPGGGCILF